MSCSKTFTLHVTTTPCWLERVPAGFIIFPGHGLAPDGVAVAVNGTNVQVLKNRIWTPFAMPVGTSNYYASAEGGVYGADYPGTGRWFYRAPSGGDTQFGPLSDWARFAANRSSENLCAYNYLHAGGKFQGQVWSPASGVVATIGDGAITEFYYADGVDASPALNGEIIYLFNDGALNYIYTWSPTGGSVDMGFPGALAYSIGFSDIASTGHAVLLVAPAFAYTAYFWNGVTSTSIYAPVQNIDFARINASDTIVGVLGDNSAFWRWTAGTGVVSLGLPPGAASGSNIWITDSDLIICNANNGSWHYHDGAWADATELLPPDSGFTAVGAFYDVNKDGHGLGYGTYEGAAGTRFVCKFCSP